MKILITKYGGRFVTRAYASANSAAGEQGETEGLIRYLVQQGHDVCYFGRYLGEPLCQIVEPNIQGFNENTTSEEQLAGFEKDIAALPWAPDAFVMSAGYSATMSMVDNPNCTTVQAASVRYIAPHINILTHFKIPRIVVNNDPRTYPKDQEMSLGWPYARPCALLDQTEGDYMTIVGRTRYMRRSVYTRAESWAYHVPRENTREYSAVCIAHAHIKDGCKQRDRVGAWYNVLEGNDIAVYGKGWQHYPHAVNYQGVLDPEQVMDVLNTCECCPCVAQKNFYTGKVYVVTNQGCVPLLYGDGADPYTWDPKELFLPLDSPLRIRRPGDLAKLQDIVERDYDSLIGEWRERCQPDWTKLDDCLDELAGGADWQSQSWWQRWGGYWRIG